RVGGPATASACRSRFFAERKGFPLRILSRRFRIRLEVHRHAVDAVAQVGRRWAVVEHVAEMAAAAAAMYLGADHAVAAISGGLDRAGHRIVEARPAGAALELHFRDEQRLVAAGAGERASALLVVKRAAARRPRGCPAAGL